MTCYSPYHVHVGDPKPNGKMNILWTGQNKGARRIDLPDGKCIGCKLERSRNWSSRCVCEAQMHESNSFITLTFNDQSLPLNRSLDVRTLQLFFKRLRKEVDVSIRYFACGEYGDKLGRPHYHSLIFGYDFPDKELYTVRNGNRLYTSRTLERVWPFGFSSVGEFSASAASYVARYCLKKVSVSDVEHYVDKVSGEVLTPEFVVMSRRPGIGSKWFDKYAMSDVYPRDTFVMEGAVNKPPRYFDKLLEKVDPQMLDEVKQVRADYAPQWEEGSDVRLRVKEQVKLAQIQSLKRELR